MTEIKVRNCDNWQTLPTIWPDSLRRIFSARGIQTEDDVYYQLEQLPKPDLMLGMDTAVQLLIQAINEQWRITIVADFDTDGATSCALAIRALKMMGVTHVDYIVPNRFTHGYGLSRELLDDMSHEQQPDLLFTVDNGIASIDGVEAAHERGIKVLITDHHLPGDTLPKAEAIVNPNQYGDTFPSKNLAGVGVCFYVMLALRTALRQQNWFEKNSRPEPKLNQLFDLLALGTVADVVPLDKLNRTLVILGLKRIRAGYACAGIKALIAVSKRDHATLVSSDLGFSIGPRLNAAGRLEDMGLGIDTLLLDDNITAEGYAQALDDVNKQRREIEQDMQQQALTMLDELKIDDKDQALAYCLYDPAWHQGVIGLLASRIKERQHRPVIAFAQGKTGELKGSARSIPGVHIRDVLALVASKAPHILSKFGGHAMAAGLTLAKKDLAEFEQLFLAALKQIVKAEDLQQQILSDGELSAKEMNITLAEQIANAAPWGQHFPEPQFHGEFKVLELRAVGAQGNHLRLILDKGNGQAITAMAFNHYQKDWLEVGGQLQCRYRLSVNEFRQQRTVQLLIDILMPVE